MLGHFAVADFNRREIRAEIYAMIETPAMVSDRLINWSDPRR